MAYPFLLYLPASRNSLRFGFGRPASTTAPALAAWWGAPAGQADDLRAQGAPPAALSKFTYLMPGCSPAALLNLPIWRQGTPRRGFFRHLLH